MLIAYHEGYLALIKICALFCILVMVYNLYDHLTQKRRERQLRIRTDRIRQVLENYDESSVQKQKTDVRQLTRMLKNPRGLLALMTALDELGWTESTCIPAKTRRMLCDALIQLHTVTYRRAEDYVQGLLINLFIRCDVSSSRVKEWLLKCVESPRPLLRGDALRCICAQRNRKMVLLALKRISEQPLPFSNKLITDTLMTFRGNKELLLEELWQGFSGFSPEIQVSVLQLLAEVDSGSYARQVMLLLENENTDTEVRIAAIKFFATVDVPQCVPVMAKLLEAETWEYAAIAAKALANYDCTGIFSALKQGLSSRNWYIRSNCARAIVSGCSPEQVEEARNVADRYGRDSIRYALEMLEKEVAAV